jgi:uncharacterized protein YndB with AHSA1/START domain
MKFSGTVGVVIKALPAKVWEALTNPVLVKQYFFGTNVKSDWRKGSSITWSGEYEGKNYEDKGEVLEVEPEKLLSTTYWSSMSGLPDVPENYQQVTYRLIPEGQGTTVEITQENSQSQESVDHSLQNWKMVLDGLKKLVENE